jgi:DNA-binding response OmpR family regulator
LDPPAQAEPILVFSFTPEAELWLGGEGGSMRVLLIEDDAVMAGSIGLMLKSENFNVYTTDLGEEGIDLGKLYEYDIILLDLNLPDISGYEVAPEIIASSGSW